ncbi:bacteriohemerythrin, partial [Acinetobacter baumannii]|nr:hemerythrin [Acinetobacter baumannii]EKY1687447.1 hemerythrin [Acinetobacter baumannii]
GHTIEAELQEILAKWLINHIQHDDADYVGAVKENMMGIIREKEKKKGKNWFARFFS